MKKTLCLALIGLTSITTLSTASNNHKIEASDTRTLTQIRLESQHKPTPTNTSPAQSPVTQILYVGNDEEKTFHNMSLRQIKDLFDKKNSQEIAEFLKNLEKEK